MLSRPKRTETRVVLRYPFMEVREHDVVDEGVPKRAVVTVHLEDWAIVCAIAHDGRFILVEQHRHGTDAPSLELAGGIVDPGETPEEAARRELLEETGYAAEKFQALGWVHPNPALHDNRAFFFLAEGATKVAEQEDHPDERIEIHVLAESDVARMVEDGRITHALAILGIARARQRARGQRELTSTFRVLDEMERHQRDRVVALAHRLHPTLTMEDIASPHDFPELDDPDWHFEDGQLAAIQAVRYALQSEARKRDSDAKED
jgi:ADP-ribose pyrophosphatase